MKDKVGKKDPYTQLTDYFMANCDAEEGTMMGFKCLRYKGQFFASQEPKTGALIIKVPQAAVTELINSGAASPFSPNGRTFKEWASIKDFDESSGKLYLNMALAFVKLKKQ